MRVLSAFMFVINTVILQSRINISFEGFLMQASLFNGTIVGAFQLQNLSMLQYSSCSTSQVNKVYACMHTLHCMKRSHNIKYCLKYRAVSPTIPLLMATSFLLYSIGMHQQKQVLVQLYLGESHSVAY